MWKTQCTLLSKEKIVILVPAQPASPVLKMAHCWSRDGGVETISSRCEAERAVPASPSVTWPVLPIIAQSLTFPEERGPSWVPVPSPSVHRIHGVCELGSENNRILVCIDFQLELHVLLSYTCRRQSPGVFSVPVTVTHRNH